MCNHARWRQPRAGRLRPAYRLHAESRHSCSRIVRWSGPGPTMRAVGRSNSDDTKANAVSTVDGGLNIRGLVAIRTNPASTRTDRAKGSGPVARRVSQFGVLGVFGSGILKVRVYQNVDIGKQHLRSGGLGPKLDLVFYVMSRASRDDQGPHLHVVWLPRIVTSRNGGGSDGL